MREVRSLREPASLTRILGLFIFLIGLYGSLRSVVEYSDVKCRKDLELFSLEIRCQWTMFLRLSQVYQRAMLKG